MVIGIDTNTKWLIGLGAMAAALRLAVVCFFFGDYVPTGDAAHWHTMALNFLDGRGLIVNEKMVAYRTPVPGLYFALIYGIFGVSVRAVQMANVCLGVLTVWLAYDLARRLFGVIAARAAGLLVCIYPTNLLYTGQMLSETPVVMLILSTLWLAWLARDRGLPWRIAVGIVLGIAVLTRQTVLPMAVLIALWAFFFWASARGGAGRIGAPLLIFASLALPLVPWSARNYLLTKTFIPLTSEAGTMLWMASAGKSVPEIDALPEGLRGSTYQGKALRFIADNPWPVLARALQRFTILWHLHFRGGGFAEVAFLTGYLPLIGVAIAGVWVAWRVNRQGTLLLLTVPIALTVTHMVFYADGRYRLPAEAILCLFASCAVMALAQRMLTPRAVVGPVG